MENRMKLNMFDDYWIDFRPDTIRRWFAPTPFSQVKKTLGYGSIVCDKKLGVYRLYYEVAVSLENNGVRNLYMIESTDLRSFSEPLLVYEGDGGVHGMTVFLDDHDPDPARRYKLCGMTRLIGRRKDPEARKRMEVELGFSADGKSFVCDHTWLITEHTSDSDNNIFYNPIFEEYNLLHRSAYVDRRIAVKTSKDLKQWSDPHIVLQPSPVYGSDGFQTQQYGMVANYYDGIFYGLLWQYRTIMTNTDWRKMAGVIEPELVYSYDGHEFLHTSGKTLIERPEAPQPGCAGICPFGMVESLDGEYYYLYLGTKSVPHATDKEVAVLVKNITEQNVPIADSIYRIRKDRFCGIEGPGTGAQVITKTICLDKVDLSLNLNASCGSARFALTEYDLTPLPGFSYDDCIPFEFKDGTDVRPQWKEHRLSEVLGKRVRICVELNSATLHCITAAARPYIVEIQKSFAEPIAIS